MRAKLAILSILLILLLFTSCAGGGEWSYSLNVSNNEKDSLGASLAVDKRGNVHLAWYDYTPGNNDIFYSSKPDNGSFSGAINITKNSGQSQSPALVAGNGALYLFWTDYTPGQYNILFATKAENGSWSETINLTPQSKSSDNPSAVADSEGNLHLVWQEGINYADKILYATKPVYPLPTPTPMPTPAATPTATPTLTPVPTSTPIPETTPTSSPTATPVPVTTPIPMNTYSNDQFGYSVAYPDTWQVDDYYFPKWIQISPEAGLALIMIEERDLAEGTTLESFYNSDLEEARENYANFELVSTTEVRKEETLPGVEVIIVTSPKQAPELKFKNRTLYMLRGQQGFIISVSSLLDTWETYAPLFDSVIRSFNLSITPPMPTPTPTPGPTATPTSTLVVPIAEGWSSPQILSQEEGESQEPVLAIDSQNTLHLAWVDNTPGNWDIFYRAKPAGGEWSAPVNVSNNAGESRVPAIAVDSQGTVHLVWHDYSSGNWEIVHNSKPKDGSWTTVFNVSANSGESGSPALAIDSKDSIHLVWNDNTGGNWEILYITKPVNGAWAKAINVSNTKGQSGDPVIALSREDSVYLAWSDDTTGNWEIFYTKK